MRKDYNKVSKNTTTIVDENAPLQSDPLITPPDPTPPKDLIPVVVTNCQRLNVRADPSIRSSVLCVIAKGDAVGIIETNLKWAHIVTDAGVDGYVMREFIKEA